MKRIVAASMITAALLAAPGWPPAWAGTAEPPQGEQQPAGAPPAAASAAGPAAPAGTAAPPQAQDSARGPKASNVKQWLATNKRTVKDTLKGVLAGGLAGALTAARRHQSIVKGVLIGAAVGGVAGFLIGHAQDKVYAGRDQAVELAHYDPSQGYVMRVEEMSVEPANAKPGEAATLTVRYLVIGPDPHEAITVNCFRGIKYQDDYIFGNGPSSFVVPHGGGIVTSRVQVTIPKEAPAGTYAVEAMFDDPRGRFQQASSSPLYIAS